MTDVANEGPFAIVAMPDAAIRLAILNACRKPRTNPEVAAVVERLTGWVVSNRQVGNMAAALHRAGWLTYRYDEHGCRHEITAAGFQIYRLIRLGALGAR